MDEQQEIVPVNKKRRSVLKIVLITVAIIIFILIAVMQTLVFIVYDEVFKKRYTDEANFGYYRREHYSTMTYAEVEFSSDFGQKLTGFLYEPSTPTEYKGIVVLNHGFGSGGHDSYLPAIEFLTKNQYMVLGFDKTGNDLSEGENVKGLPQGVIDLEFALDFVREDTRTKNLPILLFGHSWGGYSVCSSLEKQTDITATVSLSAFNRSMDVLIEQGGSMVGFDISMLAPFLAFCDLYNFGFDSFYSVEKGLAATNSPVLLVQGSEDELLNIDKTINYLKKKFKDKPNISYSVLEGSGHNIPYSIDTMQYIKESSAYVNNIREKNPNINREELVSTVFQEIDRERLNAIDIGLMTQIVEFYDDAIANSK